MLRLNKGDTSELSWNPLLGGDTTPTSGQDSLGTWENVALAAWGLEGELCPDPEFAKEMGRDRLAAIASPLHPFLTLKCSLARAVRGERAIPPRTGRTPLPDNPVWPLKAERPNCLLWRP